MRIRIPRFCAVFFAMAYTLHLPAVVPAADALAADSSQEVRIGPVRFSEKIDSTSVDLRISLFANFRVQGSTLQSDARLILDLSDIQSKAGQLLKVKDLPNDECSVRVSIGPPSLHSVGADAIFRIDGSAELWACALGIKTRILTQDFTVDIPARLSVQGDGRTLKIHLEDPQIDFDGLAGNLGAGDLAGPLAAGLLDGIRSKLSIDPIPQELSPYQPRIHSARFFSNDGRLAAEIRLGLAAGGPALTQLAQSLVDQRR